MKSYLMRYKLYYLVQKLTSFISITPTAEVGACIKI